MKVEKISFVLKFGNVSPKKERLEPIHRNEYLVGGGNTHGPVGGPPCNQCGKPRQLGPVQIRHSLESSQLGHGAQEFILEWFFQYQVFVQSFGQVFPLLIGHLCQHCQRPFLVGSAITDSEYVLLRWHLEVVVGYYSLVLCEG